MFKLRNRNPPPATRSLRCGAASWSLGRQQAANLASGPGPHPGHARDRLVVRPDVSGDRRRS
jgi:hypothetical protein